MIHIRAALPCAVTSRELEVIDRLLEGATARDVARELRLSFHTVRTHIRNIYEKLGVMNRIELLRWREGPGPRRAISWR